MYLMQKIWLVLVLLRYFLTVAECQKSLEKTEEIFKRLGPKTLLTTFTKTEKVYKYAKETCQGQLLVYANSIRKGETWALKMLDSSSKIPSGILTGNIIDLGMFDECMSVQATKGSIQIHGRHCMYLITFLYQNSSIPVQPAISICVPSACAANDIETFLNKTIRDIKFIDDLGITEVTATCSSVGPQIWSTGSIVSVTIVSIFVIFLTFCTFLDILQRSKSLPPAVTSNMAEFSLYKNAQKIFNTTVNSNSLTPLFGIRCLSICWIVLGHQYLTSIMSVNVNSIDIVDWITSWKSLYIFTAPFAVDTFFMLSGLLVTYMFLKEMSTGRKFNIFSFYFHRYVRLTPPIAALLIISIFIIPYMGSGPRWEEFISLNYSDKCKEKWWSFLLYTNNYIQNDNSCLAHLWYLAIDMQFFLISPLILYPLSKKPKLGLAIWSLLFVSQIATPAALIAINKYTSMVFELGENMEKTMSMFQNLYIMAYARGGSWLVGVMFGYIIVTKRSEFDKKTIYIGWICSLASLTFCTFGVRTFQQKDYVYNTIWEAVFGSLSRPLWAASVGWIILACVFGYGGPVNTFLSHPIFIPLSRVSYCVYLLHFVIQSMKVFAIRTPYYFSDFRVKTKSERRTIKGVTSRSR
ncbi:nose resistant to fluoxetine protein 6-like isoform X2 [Belonocnema kinseyi]|uniref:nose resistant to fluoxetine protein 6-like isoform X2 n=1 Tax=Belonocnema kinseyi TaxID=2817044 RepID=UPI00143D6A60|nr:nose resistant to fluoxetine protein 6-like isoform X2 [Belonocnema kinseyi]